MSRHLTRRACGKQPRFNWSRFVSGQGAEAYVTYRLYRRDHRNAVHMSMLTFLGTDSRAYIAQRLNRARHQLRDKVDDIDLAAMLSEDQAA